MKKFLALTWLLVATCAALGQGTVNLVNRVVNVVDAPIFDTDGASPLAGAAFRAQLYAGSTQDSLLPVGPPLPFRTGAGVGYIDPSAGSSRSIPTVPPGGTAFVQVRVWETAKGPTYEAAQAAGGKHGASLVFSVVTGGVLSPPAALAGLTSFQLRFHSPPAIELPPAQVLVAPGGTARFGVVASGSPPISYQWRKAGSDIAGATGESFEIHNASSSDAALYSVRVTNAFGSIESSGAALTVTLAPVITQVIVTPAGLALVGRPLHLEVAVEGLGPFTFQWSRNGLELAGETSRVLDQLAAAAGTYSVRVANTDGATSLEVVTVSSDFAIELVVSGGGTVIATPPGTFHTPGTLVTLRATPDPGYLFAGWLGDIIGTANPTTLVIDTHKRVEALFTVPGGSVHFINHNLALGFDAPVFDVDGVTRLAGSGFVVQLYAGPTPELLQPIGPPIPFLADPGAGYFRGEDRSITNVPRGQTAYVQMRAWETSAGATFEAAVQAGGKHGTNVPVAVVTGNAGNPPSPPALTVGFDSFALRLAPPPVITGILISPSPQVGRPIRLEALVQGVGPLTYAWLRGEIEIPGATTAIYQSTNAEAGTYGIRVAGPGGTTFQIALTLTNEFVLHFSAGRGGVATATPSRPTYVAGTDVELRATPHTGYAFARWSGDFNATNNPARLTMNADKRVEALFTPLGGTVFFVNRDEPLDFDAPVFDTDGTNRLAGPAFVAQLYAGPSTNLLGPVGSAIPFLSGMDAGYFSGVERSILGVAPGGVAHLQLRAWALAAGETYEQAAAAGGKRGSSPTLSLTTGNAGSPPTAPPIPVGLSPFALREGLPPTIVTPPSAITAIAGQPATLQVTATGGPPLRFQWSHDGTPVGGATNAQLVFAAAMSTNAGLYSVRVFNDLGEAIAPPVPLTVLEPPVITNLTAPITIFAGEQVVIEAAAKGSSPLDFQWFEGNAGDETRPIGGNSPRLEAGTPMASTAFWTRVSNAAGSTNSSAVTVTVTRRPQTLTFPPLAPTAVGSAPVPLAATASSGLPVVFTVVAGPGSVAGNLLSPTAAGTILVRALQSGDAFYMPAPSVDQTLIVNPGAASIVLAPLLQTFNGGPRIVTAVTQPADLATAVTYDGSPNPPVNAGSYAVLATIIDPNYTGSSSGILVVGPASAIVTLTRLDQAFDGTPRQPDATVAPAGLPLRLSFDGGPLAPSAPGEYIVEAVVDQPNYTGRATGTFRIGAAVNVAGRVFNDANSSGTQDPGEKGLSGVVLRLLEVDGVTAVRSVSTDGNGAFTFQGVASGNYYVEQHPPPGYASTTASLRSVAVQRNVVTQVDFGNQAVGTVVGVVYEDIDGDGKRDEVEKGLPGVLVHLSGPGGSRSTMTVADGTYLFGKLNPGAYAIEQTDPSGYVSTTPNLRNVSVAPGGAANASFGEQAASTIAGVVFQDDNGNGLHEDSEPGIPGVAVRLEGSAGVSVVASAPDGSFLFENITPGSYTIQADDPPGTFSTTPNVRTLTLPSGGSVGVSFGDQVAATISGFVFEDRDGNGMREPDEPGIDGVSIRLSAASGERTVISAGDGAYLFTEVSPGSYALEGSDPAGYSGTTPNLRSLSVASGGAASASFGVQAVGTIAGTVFEDSNGNGLCENGEAGIGGVTILLSGADGVRTTATSGDGSFLFAGITPGAYTVNKADPPGFTSTTPNVRAVSVASGASASAIFGQQPVKTISGLVFEDQNGNGTFDRTEPGMGGVRLVLLRTADQTAAAETQTTGGGLFAFADVPAGNYLVRQSVPPDYTALGEAGPAQVRLSALAQGGTPEFVVKPVELSEDGAATVNFGNIALGSLSGSVFNDLDGDGSPSPGEPGVGGAQIDVRISGTTTIAATTTTAGTGAYLFPGLVKGVFYQVRVRPVSGFEVANAFSNVSFQAGAATANFVLRATGTISGCVFNDENGDGIDEPSEPGVGGVTISFYRPDSGETITALTSGDGCYLVNDILPGTVRVDRTAPPGFEGTTPASLVVALGPGAAASASFGLRSETVRPPTILTEPADLALAEGAAGMLSVSASGTDPIEYQWLKNGVPIPQATGTTLVLAPARPTDAAAYQVQVRNAVGAVLSKVARLTISSGDAYLAWAIQYLPPDQGGPDQDPDGDRRANLLEFVLGTDPVAPTADALPRLTIVQRNGASFLAFEFRTRPSHDARLFLEASDDLAHWREIQAGMEPAGDLIRIVDAVPLSTQPRRFIRLGVTTTNPPQ